MRVFGLVLAFLILLTPPAAAAERFIPIQDIKTPGGIRVWLIEDHSLPLISLRLAFLGSGARNDTRATQGLARLLSNTLDEGAGPHDSETFQKILTDKSISLSFSMDKDHFYGSLYLLAGKVEQGFTLLGSAVTQTRFDADPVRRMIEANQARIRAERNDPDWIAARLMNHLYFGSHPYALNSGGTLSALSALTPAQLRRARDALLTRDRMMVAVTGNITPAEIARLLDTHFAALPQTAKAGGASAPIPAASPPPYGLYGYTLEIPQTIIRMQGPGIAPDDPDYFAALVANTILGGGGFGSRLAEEVREKRGLTYGIGTSLIHYDRADVFTLATSTQATQTEQALDLIGEILRGMINAPPSTEEIQAAKDYLVGSMPLALTSSNEISGLMIDQMATGRPIDDLDRRAAHIRAVSPADIARVAPRLFNPDQMITVLVGPKTAHPAALKTIPTLPDVD